MPRRLDRDLVLGRINDHGELAHRPRGRGAHGAQRLDGAGEQRRVAGRVEVANLVIGVCDVGLPDKEPGAAPTGNRGVQGIEHVGQHLIAGLALEVVHTDLHVEQRAGPVVPRLERADQVDVGGQPGVPEQIGEQRAERDSALRREVI